MKRRNITKASQERAVLSSPTSSASAAAAAATSNNEMQRHRRDSRTSQSPAGRLRQSLTSSSTSSPLTSPDCDDHSDKTKTTSANDNNNNNNNNNNGILLVVVTALLVTIFVGLPLLTFGWYMIQHEIHHVVRHETLSAILWTLGIAVFLVFVLTTGSTSSPLLRRLVPTWNTNQKKDDDLLQPKEDATIYTEKEEDEVWIQPKVRVLSESSSNVSTDNKPPPPPLILNEEQRQAIANEGGVLPRTLADHYWKRVYSLARDGDTFEACLKAMEDERRTLIVIRTSQNHILGGYASVAWKTKTSGLVPRDNQGGGPDACVFCFRTATTNNTSNDGSCSDNKLLLHVYRWTGANCYTQLIDTQRQQLAMGAGSENYSNGNGNYAWSVERNFTIGTTGRCPTFDNEPLCQPERFDIIDMEVYGFSVC